MYFLTTEFFFEAAHFLKDYDGDCAKLHGHSYKVEVTVKGDTLQKNGILVDFKLLKKIGKGIIKHLDHTFLNDVIVDNPTAENIARLIYHSFVIALPLEIVIRKVSVDSVKVWETEGNCAVYRED